MKKKGRTSDPTQLFRQWFEAAVKSNTCTGFEPNAMTLATCGPQGPSARIVLLKSFDTHGFVFFTNYESRKGQDILFNPSVAALFHWPQCGRQVRIEGRAEKVSEEESDAYFQSRPRASRLGALISMQSQTLASRGTLRELFDKARRSYRGKFVPRPSTWGGFRIVADRFEFWEAGAGRLHTRRCYTRAGTTWKEVFLFP